MRIVFICGSLEPGRDGVGDYVRRLAVELLRHYDNNVSALALNDTYVSKEFLGEQLAEGMSLTVLRLPSLWSSKKRFSRAQDWITTFQADWLSLQFVPFSFDARGLPMNLSYMLFHLGRGRLWHIMFHELWVGIEQEASKKQKLWGKAQQLIVKVLILQLKPKVIHTQTQLYKVLLAKLGFEAKQLSLFGNIPVTPLTNTNTNNSIGEPFKGKESIELVIFGGIHSGAPIENFAQEASKYSQEINTPITLTIVGRNGKESEHWKLTWERFGLTAVISGEQPSDYISELLQKSTFGITTTPSVLVEKSGTTAAMQEHGLPVICVGRNWNPRNITGLKTPLGVRVYNQGNFNKCVSINNAMHFNNTVSQIASQFTSDLNNGN